MTDYETFLALLKKSNTTVDYAIVKEDHYFCGGQKIDEPIIVVHMGGDYADGKVEFREEDGSIVSFQLYS